jgi:hypothetical protein
MINRVSGFIALLAILGASPAACAAAEVRVGHDRELLVDGKPLFPLFVWLQPPQLFDLHKQLGMNAMMGEGAKGETAKEFLDACKAKGLWGIVHAAEKNRGLKDHPALLTWMFADEPDLPAQQGYQPPAFVARGDATASVWWEGEKPVKTNIQPATWMDVQHPYLSGGRWLAAEARPAEPDKPLDIPLWARYEIEVRKAGRYQLWVREFVKNWASPTAWRFDAGPWKTTPRDLEPIEAMKVHRVLSVGWTRYGEVELTAGKHVFEIRADEVRTAGRPGKTGENLMIALDAYLLTTAKDEPLSPPKPPRPRTTPDEVLTQYRAWKKLDPNRPIYLNLTASFLPQYKRYEAQDKLYDAYCRATDLVGFDHYPIYGWGRPDRLPEVADATRRLRAYAGDRVPVWVILETGRGGQWVSDTMRAPFPYEIRAEVWMAIVNGATGIGYFPHVWKPRYNWCEIPAENQQELKRLNAQITRLAPVILGPASKKQIACKTTPDGRIDLAVREHQGSVYVFAVSLGRQKLRADFAMPGLERGAKIEVLDEQRSLTSEAGGFGDEFGELAVHLYRVSLR